MLFTHVAGGYSINEVVDISRCSTCEAHSRFSSIAAPFGKSRYPPFRLTVPTQLWQRTGHTNGVAISVNGHTDDSTGTPCRHFEVWRNKIPRVRVGVMHHTVKWAFLQHQRHGVEYSVTLLYHIHHMPLLFYEHTLFMQIGQNLRAHVTWCVVPSFPYCSDDRPKTAQSP